MARIKKYSPEQNLTSFQTFVIDDNPNSDYFRITEFKDTFTGGKNGFLIEGSEHLKESTEIKIEILDVEGNPIYYEPGNGIPEYYEGISKLIAVYVYEDTPIGLGKITVLGELKQYDDNGVIREIPAEWQGAYNVKWERTFQINKNLANEDKVRFYRRPVVNIDEIVKPIFSGNPPSVTQTGSVDGIPLVPNENINLSNFSLPTSYRLRVNTGDNWTGSIEGQTISFDNINYSPTIDEVVNKTEIVVSPPYTENNLVKSFTNEDYSITFPYIEGVGDLATALTGSFAKINITDMKTFVGDSARVKVYRRSQSNLTDFEFVQEIQLESNELLRDIETFAKNEELYGQFTEAILGEYWVTSSNDFNLEFNQDFLYNSAKLNSSPSNYFLTSQSLSIQNGVEYTLGLNVRKSTNISGDYLKVFLSGSYNGTSVSQTITQIDSSNGILQKTNFTENIIADNFDSARLYFEVSGSDWYVNNISLKASQETSFSPDEITFIQQVPKTLVKETFDYRFEFYDINNNYIPVTVEKTKTFVGGNNNLFNKSLEITPDNLYFSFDSASNPANAVPPLVINFDVETTLVTGSITYTSGAYDFFGNEISQSEYVGGQYPGYLTDWNVDNGRQPFLRVQDFTGSREDITVQFIRYTAEVEGVSDTFIITRVEDGKGGVSFEIVPFRGTQIKNKESKTLEVQAVRVDGINRIDLQSGLDRGFSDAKLHLLSSSLDGTQTYVSLSQAITDTNFVEGISAGLTGSGEIDYNAIFTRDTIDNELTLYLMDGPTSSSILTSLILTDLKDGLNNGVVTSTTDQFNIKYEPRKLSPFAPQQSIVTASFQRRGTTLNPLSASLVIYPSSSIEPKTELPHFYMFYETGAFDDTITVAVTDYLGNSIDSGRPGNSVPYYTADETKQLNLEFTYTEPITSASVTANKSFFITPDGLPGQNAIIIDIDPQPVALGSNHKGEVYNYTLANTDIQVTQGDLFLINTASGDPGTFTTRSITPTNIQFTSLVGDSTTTMSLAGFETMSALSASVKYDFDIYPYFTSSLVTASRTQKFTKVVEGAGAIEVTLDPIAVSFNADESGFISNYSAASTEVFIKQNDEFLIYDPTNAGTPGTFLTASISASGITFSEISSSQRDTSLGGDEILHFKGFSGIERTQPSASVVYNFRVYPYSLKAGVAGVPTIVSKTQTFSKVNDGSAARKVSLRATSDTVIYDGDGTKVAPSGDIILTATAVNNSGSAYFKFLNDEGGTIGASSTLDNLTLGDLPNAGTASTFTVELRDGNPNGIVLDTDSVTITGIQEGSTAYSVVLSNPASSVTVEVDGTKYFDNSGTLLRAYKGGTELQFVEEYDTEALDPITFLPIGTFGQFSASIHEISTFLTHSDGRIVETSGQLYGSSSGVLDWNNPQDNTQGFITYKIDFENGRGTQFVQQSFSTVFEGATGPGVVFRGPWTGSIEYIYNKDSKRRDAVLWSENGLEPYDTYYATKDSGSSYLVPSGSGNEPTIGGVLNDLYWESLGQEEFFVAAKIAIFEESFVKNTINVGQPATSYETNPQITIFGGDSEPYISIGQSIQGYGQEGVFIGVTEDGGPNGTAGTTGLLSIEDSTGDAYFRWDGYGLEIKSDDVLIETDNLTIDSQNEKISLGQGTQGFQEEGIYVGKDNTDYTLSLRGAPVGGEYNALEWDGSTLTLRGALRQTAAGVVEPSLRGTWASGTTYYPQDLVQYLGETWSSDTQHTSTNDTNASTGVPGSGPWTIAAGAGKGVNLLADTYVIAYDAAGSNPTPSGTLNLIASSSNFVNGFYKFTGGGAVFTDETSFTDGLTANTDEASFTIPSTYFSTPLTFRVGVAEGDQDEKISDTITITAVQPGADSTPMYFITSIAGGTQIKNSSGNIELQVQKSDSTGLTNLSSGDIKIYSGATVITSVSGVTGTDYNPTISATAINGTLTLTLKDGSTTYDTITLVDVTDGLGGGSFISPNLKSTRNPADNSFTPTLLQATASFYDTSGTEYQGRVTITPSFSGGVDRMAVSTKAGDSEVVITAGDGDGGSVTLGGASVPTKDIVLTAIFTDPATGQTNTINETFYIISDGADGIDAITVISSNQAHTLPADSAGTVSSYAGSGTTLSVYEGITQLDYDGVGTSDGKWTVTASGSSITAGSITESTNDAVVGVHSSMGATQASVTYTISGKRGNGESFTAETIQTLTKSVAGTAGTNGQTGASVNIIFIRNANQPSTPSPSSGVPSGWSDSPPSGTDLLWASQGTKGVGDTNFTWGTPYQVEGTAVAETTIYRLNSNAGNTGGSYNFVTSTLTPPTNWSATVPSLTADLDVVYASNGLFSGAPTSTGSLTTWSTPVVYAQRIDGTNGTNGVNGTDGAAGTPSGIVYAGAWTLTPKTGTASESNRVIYLAEEQLKYVTKYETGGTKYWVCATTHQYAGTFNGSADYLEGDVVLSSGTYYRAGQDINSGDFYPGDPEWPSVGSSIAPGSWAGGWTAFGAEFTSVATDILFATDVYADKTINIGSDGGAPVIALNADADNANANPYISIGQGGTQGFGEDGIFLGFALDTASFSIFSDKTDPEAAFVQFDGTNFSYSGLVTGSSVQGGELLIGFDTHSNTYQFRVDGSGNLISSGSNSRFQGSIYASSGNIGTWEISDKALSSEYISLDADENQITVADTGGTVRFNANSDTALPSLTSGTSFNENMSTTAITVSYSGDSGTAVGEQDEQFIPTSAGSSFNPSVSGKHKVSFTYNNANQSYSSATGDGSYSTLRLQLVISTSSTAAGVADANIVQYGTAVTVSSSGYDTGGYVSVTGDTKIRLFDGSTKLAKDCKVGDYILSWDEVLGKFVKAKLSQIRHRVVDRIFRVCVGDKIVDVSDTHGFWINGGMEIKVQDIIEGQTEIYYKDGDTIRFGLVDSVEEIFGEFVVYTFSVPKYLNYVSNELISHNLVEQIPIQDTDYIGSPYTFILNNVQLNNGTNYYPYLRTLSTYTVLVTDALYGISNRTQLNAGALTIVPLSAGVIVNGGGMQSVVDASNYFRFRTNPGSDPYKTDVLGGISIDTMYGYDISNSNLSYLKASYPWIVKGYVNFLHSSTADVSPSGGTATPSANSSDVTFYAGVNIASVVTYSTREGIYRINYSETYATGKEPGILAFGGRLSESTSTTWDESERVALLGIAASGTSYCYIHSADPNSNNLDLEAVREMTVLILG